MHVLKEDGKYSTNINIHNLILKFIKKKGILWCCNSKQQIKLFVNSFYSIKLQISLDIQSICLISNTIIVFFLYKNIYTRSLSHTRFQHIN